MLLIFDILALPEIAMINWSVVLSVLLYTLLLQLCLGILGLNYCDYLVWRASVVQYAFVSGNCFNSSYCGSMYLALTDVVSHAVWWLGASKEYLIIVIVFGGIFLLFIIPVMEQCVMIALSVVSLLCF